jgi:CRP-like cAMP-binding protein
VSDHLQAIQQLQNLPLFRRLDPEVLRSTAKHWRFAKISKDEVLWLEGDAQGSLGVVVAGVLGIILQNQLIASLGPGELVGEGTAFIPKTGRIATVRAQSTSLVASLEQQALMTLRTDHGPVYDALLDDAVRTVARRVRDTDRKVARLSSGEESLSRKGPSVVGRVWQRLTGQAAESRPPDLTELLNSMLVHPVRGPSVVERLAKAFEPERLDKGKALFLEGDKADKAYILVSGGVDVYRYTGGQKARKLASLDRGSLFGFGGLMIASTRAASIVVSDGGWAFSIDKSSFNNLDGHPARYFKEILLKSLQRQVGIANEHLAALEINGAGEGKRGRRDTLDRAVSALVGHQFIKRD